MLRISLLTLTAAILAASPLKSSASVPSPAGDGSASAARAEVAVSGRVVDQSGLALPGVTLRLTPLAGSTAEMAVTGADGTYAFQVAEGDYKLDAELDGFEPASRAVRVAPGAVLPDLVLSLAGFTEATTVVAALPTEVQPDRVGAPATIAEHVIDNAPLRSSRYEDVLPLLPNVVRGPDGLVSVAGARAPQGVVLLNGVPSSDVATGDPVAAVPVGALETVQVIATSFPAEYGPTTGGVTIINSRSGSDDFLFTVNSFTPRPRLESGSVRGVEAWDPKASVRGPLARGRAWFAQSIDYHFERTRADTLAGAQDRRDRAFTSFSQVDARAGSRHALTAWVNGRQEHVDGERLGAFTPLGTVPVLERGAWSGAAIDRAAFETSTLETRVGVRRQDVSLSPTAGGSYLVGHDITRGGYFETVDRQATSVEAALVFSRAFSGRGHHVLKAGGSVVRRELDGVSRATPVTYLRSDLTPARVVEFVGPGSYAAASTQVGLFLQDGWDLGARVRVDAGFRLDHDNRAGTLAAPRAAVTWVAGERTTVSAGAGWFAGDVPLAALAFDRYQARRVTSFDEAGRVAEPVVTYRNVVAGSLGTPHARTWSAQVDHRIGRSWQVRAAVQERRGRSEPLVAPAILGGETVALLSDAGESRSRSLETTFGYHAAAERHRFYVSYVRSSSRGRTNDFGQVEGLFRDPRLEADQSGPLPADVPHRLLVWGLFSLPARTTVAPFLDVRSGFPYSAMYDDWTWAEPRFSRRFPVFASLDLVVNKIVTLPGGMRARVGVKLYNVTGRDNGREVQADLARPDFGRTYNPLRRQVRGVFEIIWSGK